MDEVSLLPKVGVVIATRNRPEMLRNAIAGVVGQTYQGPIELVVVFDQTSPDTSLESDEPNRTIRTVSNERTPGLAGARNSGIQATQAELIAFCDDDDVWLPDKLKKQVAQLGDALTAVTGIVISYGDKEVERVPLRSEFTLENVVRHRMMEAHPSSVLVRRDALVGPIGLVDEEIPGSFAEDYDWMIRALQTGPVAVVEEPLVRVHWGQSLFSQKWAVIAEAIDYMLAKHPVFRTDRRALARLYGQRAFAHAALGRRREGLRGAALTIRTSPAERRGYLAGAVALRLVSATRLMDWAHSRGRGI